jgi:hypothetical protein
MESVGRNVDGVYLVIGDFDAYLMDVGINLGSHLDAEAGDIARPTGQQDAFRHGGLLLPRRATTRFRPANYPNGLTINAHNVNPYP